MKRTEQERIDRELKRTRKKQEVQDRRDARKDLSAGGYAKSLHALFHFDDTYIYNTVDDEEILELVLDMKENLPAKQWEPVLKKAIRLTKVEQKDQAFADLCSLLAD